jgi:hypothetical protein
MNKIPILFFSILLSVTPCVHAQQIADVRAFIPDRPTYMNQDSILHAMGTGPGSGSWTAFGDNDIEGTTDVASSSNVSLVDIGNNFWGGGSFSGSNIISTTDIAGHLASQDISRAFTCSADDIAKKKKSLPMMVLSVDTPMTHCDSLLTIGYYDQEDGQMQNGYDTLRLFMEQCPFYVGNKYNAGVASYQVFVYVDAAVSGWTGGGAGRWLDFLSWLKQVLYLNPDTQWYCDDVSDMISALQDDEAAQEAALGYVISSGKCPALEFATEYNSASYWRHYFWLDSVVGKYDTAVPYGVYAWWVDSLVNKDTLANPYDSTIPSLQQENLQILLGPQFANSVGASSPITSEALLSAQLLENPMQNEIAVSYQMGRTALVTMELRDVLGRSVPIANAKYQLEQPGDHNAAIPAPNLPSGTYYLRITTDVGDAITLKIVKE